MAFPTSPTNGQQANVNGVIYIYSSTLTAWTVLTNTGANVSANNITATNNIAAATISATGNLVFGNISSSGNVTGNYILGNGSLLTGVSTTSANINNGTSNITVVSSGGNVTVGIGGTANVAVFASTGEYVTGVVSATGNITGNYFVGNGSLLTGITSTPTSLVNGTSNVVVASNANVSIRVGGAANSAVFSNTAGFLTLSAGNTIVAPLVLGNATSLLTTPAIGAIEFSSNTLYFTTTANSRSYISTPFFFRAATTANATAGSSSPWLGVSVTLSANTTYAFQGQFSVTTTNTAPHVEQISFGGTTIIGNLFYTVNQFNANTSLGSQGNVNTQYISSSAASNITGPITSTQNTVYSISGTITTSSVSGGTFTPQWGTNVAIGTGTQFLAGRWFRIEPIAQGNGASNISVGPWA